jgi:putative tryptophan/tyrosine transport system substrate-binding protein
MRRRDFVTLLGGAAVAYPLAVRAQQSDQVRHVAVLGDSLSTWSGWIGGFAERLRELGWIEGRTVAIEYRWSDGRSERVAEAAAAFVEQKPDVIVTYGGAALALKRTTASIPIVFAIAIDPLGAGLVRNLSRPGENVTGLSLQRTDSSGRRLEVLREVVPSLHRLAIMFDGGYRASVGENEAVQAMARKLGLEPAPYEIRRPEDIVGVFDAFKGRVDALYVVGNALTEVNVVPIVRYALGARLPTSLTSANSVRAGGLMSYGADYPAIFRRAADYVISRTHNGRQVGRTVEGDRSAHRARGGPVQPGNNPAAQILHAVHSSCRVIPCRRGE